MTSAVCPYCRSAVTDADERIVCEGCDTPHHRDCYEENCGCTVFGCRCAPAEEPKVHVALPEAQPYQGPIPPVLVAVQPFVTPRRVRPAPRVRSYSPLGLTGVSRTVAPPVIPAPQPAAPDISVAPDVSAAPAASVAPVPVEMDPAVPAVSSKSKARFVLLGVFLGMLGVHNLYAGFRGKGIAQLAITLFTLGLGIPVSWIWAVIDVCTVERDSAGVQFRS